MLIAKLAKLLFFPLAWASVSVPTGLINSGSTCFLNALISCLYDLPEFRQVKHQLHRKGETVFFIFTDRLSSFRCQCGYECHWRSLCSQATKQSSRFRWII